jgi:hypothetical protein
MSTRLINRLPREVTSEAEHAVGNHMDEQPAIRQLALISFGRK